MFQNYIDHSLQSNRLKETFDPFAQRVLNKFYSGHGSFCIF